MRGLTMCCIEFYLALSCPKILSINPACIAFFISEKMSIVRCENVRLNKKRAIFSSVFDFSWTSNRLKYRSALGSVKFIGSAPAQVQRFIKICGK